MPSSLKMFPIRKSVLVFTKTISTRLAQRRYVRKTIVKLAERRQFENASWRKIETILYEFGMGERRFSASFWDRRRYQYVIAQGWCASVVST